MVSFTFFDTIDWSIHASLLTLIAYLPLSFNRNNHGMYMFKSLMLSSLIGMMKGNLTHKLTFAFFLSMLTWNYSMFSSGTILTLLSVILVDMTKDHTNNARDKIKQYPTLFQITIITWMVAAAYYLYISH